jgi:polyphosphate kinase 2 (PPK2 family)
MPINLSDYEAGAPFDGDYDEALAALQERLAHLFVSLHVHGRKAIILCEGWDASGKGGAIQRLTAGCDPRTYKVWPIAAPSEEEKAAIFDRSWYGRVLVERVEGFAKDAEWRRAYDEINELEAQLSYDGAVIVKLFFHVTQEEQDRRFEKRLDHPWKRWKVSAEDVRNRARRKEYLAAIKDMLDLTDTRWAPWTMIDGNDKKSARIAALTRVAEALSASCPAEPPPVSPEMERLAQLLRAKTD